MIEAGQQVAVIGAGVTGQSVARYIRRCGGEPVLLDTRTIAPAVPARQPAATPAEPVRWGVQQWPELDTALAVVSPGLAMDACLLRTARAAGVRLISDIDCFFAAVDKPVIGITGTNGKSTVTSLAGHLLQTADVATGVGGNLGQPALDIIAPELDCYVLELSSFQLERSARQPYFRAAMLNISEDHLDHHGDLAAYRQAKQNIYQAAHGCIVNRAEPLCQPLSTGGAGGHVVSYGLDAPAGKEDWGICEQDGQRWLQRGASAVCPVAGLPLQGQHNEANMLAACGLVYDLLARRLAGQPLREHLAAALASFRGLAHRFELVAQRHGVQFINDSKATNPGATKAALQGMPQADQVILIAGGDAKGVDLAPLAGVLRGRVKHLLVLGEAAAQLTAVAQQAGVSVQTCADLDEAVQQAVSAAVSGDCVLLSPACSSLDMFASFAQRGEQFTAAVKRILEAD